MAVLRDNKESLLTLVEVMIHDPILRWAMSPELARRHQKRDDGGGGDDGNGAAGDGDGGGDKQPTAPPRQTAQQGVQNADAERALLRVRQKLDGVEGGEQRSVEGQVQQLLQDARDPDKLCRLFPGWAAWV